MKILIIEDDPMVSSIHQQFCQKISDIHTCHIVPTLEQARNLLANDQPDIILLDNYLPDGQGVDLLGELDEVPVIMVTAANDTKTLRHAIAHGVVDYLVKPFSFERFQVAIRRADYLNTLLEQDRVEQELIDGFIRQDHSTIPSSSLTSLPKGLSILTLKKILTCILECEDYFSTQTVAETLSISRVTIKKYLHYLVKMGYLLEDIDYLTSGRPLTRYIIRDVNDLQDLLRI